MLDMAAKVADARGDRDPRRDGPDIVIVTGMSGAGTTRLTIMSFGYKYGMPVDADLVADCRFLPNPHWVPDLRPFSGLDAPVRDYVLGQPPAAEFLDAYLSVLEISLAGFEKEGKRFVTVAVGCTGGKHRSVAMVEQLASRLSQGSSSEGVWGGRAPGRHGRNVTVTHRDLGRE